MDGSEGTYCDKSLSPTRWGTMKPKNLHLLLCEQTHTNPQWCHLTGNFHFSEKAPLKQKVQIEQLYKGGEKMMNVKGTKYQNRQEISKENESCCLLR